MHRDEFGSAKVRLPPRSMIGTAGVELDTPIADPPGFDLDPDHIPRWRDHRCEIKRESVSERQHHWNTGSYQPSQNRSFRGIPSVNRLHAGTVTPASDEHLFA